jgi:hypothetical protein
MANGTCATPLARRTVARGIAPRADIDTCAPRPPRGAVAGAVDAGAARLRDLRAALTAHKSELVALEAELDNLSTKNEANPEQSEMLIVAYTDAVAAKLGLIIRLESEIQERLFAGLAYSKPWVRASYIRAPVLRRAPTILPISPACGACSGVCQPFAHFLPLARTPRRMPVRPRALPPYRAAMRDLPSPSRHRRHRSASLSLGLQGGHNAPTRHHPHP